MYFIGINSIFKTPLWSQIIIIASHFTDEETEAQSEWGSGYGLSSKDESYYSLSSGQDNPSNQSRPHFRHMHLVTRRKMTGLSEKPFPFLRVFQVYDLLPMVSACEGQYTTLQTCLRPRTVHSSLFKTDEQDTESHSKLSLFFLSSFFAQSRTHQGA